jgi:hypothetical protein
VGETILLQVIENSFVIVPPDLGLVGISFDLAAVLDGVVQESYEFLQPITIRVDYTDEQVLWMEEESLGLYLWDETSRTWSDAARTCEPPSVYTRTPVQNWFSVDICHLSQFAVFGEMRSGLNFLYMPTIIK